MKTVTKKLKDFTLSEMANECAKAVTCAECPFYEKDLCNIVGLTKPMLDREIALEEPE